MTSVLAWRPSGKGAPGSSHVGIRGYGDTGKFKIKWSTGKLIQRWHVWRMWISWCGHLSIICQLLGVYLCGDDNVNKDMHYLGQKKTRVESAQSVARRKIKHHKKYISDK